MNSLQLEELEPPPHGSWWRFIFSATPTQIAKTGVLSRISDLRRVAKSVEIESADGSLLAIKNANA